MKVRHYLIASFITTFSMQSSAECPIGDYKSTIVDEINTVRTKPQTCGGVVYPAVRSLDLNLQLNHAAKLHSTDMAVNNFFEHTGSKGHKMNFRAKAAGYVYKELGENIAAGQPTAVAVVTAWLTSSDHCINLMTASFKDMGVSCEYNSKSAFKYYWTLVLGNQ